MERRPVVDPARLDVGAGVEQLDELGAVGPVGGQRRDQRGKAGVVLVVRIGAELEQFPHERQRAVIDRVLRDHLADARRPAAVRDFS